MAGLFVWCCLTAALCVAAPCPLPAQVHDQHAEHAPPAADSPPLGVGIQERLGRVIPPDIVMKDETGREVNVKDLVNVATILVPVYYSCPNDCNFLLGALAQILPKVPLQPGKDFQVVSVSFDDQDTPETAAKRKNDFITAMGDRFPANHWTFLTGDQTSIKRFMDAIGFGFQRDGKAFKHPVVLVALSPTGKVVRYLYGATPLPFDIAMAATEAGREHVGLSVKRAIAMCYTYDPQGRKYVFDIVKVAGVGILFAIGLFACFLFFGGKKGKKPGTDAKA